MRARRHCAAPWASGWRVWPAARQLEGWKQSRCIPADLAKLGGVAAARTVIAGVEELYGSIDRAMKHHMIAVKSGSQNSLDKVKKLYVEGKVSKTEYAVALRAYQTHRGETMSETRERFAAAMSDD